MTPSAGLFGTQEILVHPRPTKPVGYEQSPIEQNLGHATTAVDVQSPAVDPIKEGQRRPTSLVPQIVTSLIAGNLVIHSNAFSAGGGRNILPRRLAELLSARALSISNLPSFSL